MTDRRLYYVWKAMKRRCDNPSDPSFMYYGAKGIRYSDKWSDFKSFEKWAFENGYAPGLSIERINSRLDYVPENCKWATKKEQMGNTSHNVKVTAFGETKNLIDWFNDPRCHLASYHTLYWRIVTAGWDAEKAIEQSHD